MKNKLLYFVIFIFFTNIITVNAFVFKTSEINISEKGDIINATNGVATSEENNIEINALSFEYNKNLSVLNAKNGVAYLTEDNIELKADELIYNENTFTIDAIGNVRIKDLSKNILVKSENILFYTKKKIIISNTQSSIEDNLGNIFVSDSFKYTLKNNLVKLKNVEFIDLDKNKLKAEKAYISLILNRFIAKDISIDFNNKSFNSGNEPRLKGNSISIENNNSTVTKGIFTTCKRNDDCPPWVVSAKEIKHDKKNKLIHYKNAWLKVYNIPVFYFPKFFHPDPTVKRQSGFLMPTIENSTTLGSSVHIPYYFVLADNKDLTLRTRLYSNEKFLIQSEYREVDANSKSNIDLSYANEKNNTSRSHFFADRKNDLNFNNFEESELNLKLQLVSNDTYLKTYKLRSPIITNDSLLTSSVGLSAYREDLSFDSNIYVYEDLTKSNSDRYEFILPDYKVEKKIQNRFDTNGNFVFSSSGYLKNFDTNVYEKSMTNDFSFNSYPNFTNFGFKNDYNILLRNINTDFAKSEKEDNNKRKHKLVSMAMFNTSYPLKKIGDFYDSILTPKLSFKFSPNSTEDLKDEDRRIDVNNIYSFNRLSSNSVEGVPSITYGTEFLSTNKLGREIFSSKIANSFKLKEDKKLPQNSNLWKKTSDIVGNIKYDPNNFFNINYDFSLNENLSDTSFQKLDTQIQINNFITTFGYLNESNLDKNESYISNSTSYKFNNNNNLKFETRKNKETKLTEFYNLIYEYRNDCLIAALEYNKDYYSIGDMKPEENIFFKLTIVPFGETSSPNLKN